MKKVFSMMLILLAMSFTMVSCSDDDDEPDPVNPIVGTWVQTNSYGTTISITFKSDQTGQIYYEYTNGNGETERFEYQYIADDQELYILGNCQLSGSYQVRITATKLTLTGSTSNGDYGTFIFEKQ